MATYDKARVEIWHITVACFYMFIEHLFIVFSLFSYVFEKV